MKNDKELEAALAGLIQSKVKNSLEANGLISDKKHIKESKRPATAILKPKVKTGQNIKEALHVTKDSFMLKTEKLSKRTKESHQGLYKTYVESFNKVSSELDAVNRYEADNYSSLYREYKRNECYNLNSIKLHELYFNNISDLTSEIHRDSIPYIKLSRDFGTFENWQFDFMACALSSREGWALTVYEPYRGVYMNVCVDGHANGIPLGCIPVIAMDMWSHSFYKDYDIDKKSYLVAMLREVNWDVVEARMALSEKCDLDALYHIKPVYDNTPEKMLDQAVNQNAPIEQVGESENETAPPTTPPAPDAAF